MLQENKSAQELQPLRALNDAVSEEAFESLRLGLLGAESLS